MINQAHMFGSKPKLPQPLSSLNSVKTELVYKEVAEIPFFRKTLLP